MNKLQAEKGRFRKEIYSVKKKITREELEARSQEVLAILEITGLFQDSQNIFFYNNLDDEVQTLAFIQKWGEKKNFYLPVVMGDDIVFRKYNPSAGFKKSSFGIMEPVGEDFTEYNKVDLVIVPGMAFDRKMNRLGRGRGFYDRFLPKLKAPKMGICFDFQLFDKIPADENDMKMNYIVSENELIW